MKEYHISINQLAEFSAATLASKKRIIKQQKVPDKLLIPWYQRAKGATRKFLKDVNDASPIDNAIHTLNSKTPENNRQRIDRSVSLEALELLKKLKFPKLLKELDYEVIVADEKYLLINDVIVSIAPEIIIKASINGKITYGGVKIHVCKSKPFNFNQSTYVATSLHQFLIEKVAKNGELVMPDLCYCLDIFAERLTPASTNFSTEFKNVKNLCSEVKSLWTAA